MSSEGKLGTFEKYSCVDFEVIERDKYNILVGQIKHMSQYGISYSSLVHLFVSLAMKVWAHVLPFTALFS